MADRSRLRAIRRLTFGFGAGVAGGWFAGLLQKPKAAAPVVRAERSRVPVPQADLDSTAP